MSTRTQETERRYPFTHAYPDLGDVSVYVIPTPDGFKEASSGDVWQGHGFLKDDMGFVLPGMEKKHTNGYVRVQSTIEFHSHVYGRARTHEFKEVVREGIEHANHAGLSLEEMAIMFSTFEQVAGVVWTTDPAHIDNSRWAEHVEIY